MWPIWGRYGAFFLYSYQVVLGLGVLAGLGITAVRLQRTSLGWLDAALASMVGALLGGRAGFVWGAWDYFQQRPSEIWQLSNGGLSYLGALAGGGLAFWLYGRWRNLPVAAIADDLAAGLVVTTALGWLACWLAGLAYGREGLLGWLTADLPDNYGVFALRYQTQAMGMATAVLILAVLWRWQGNGRFWLTLALLSASQTLITFYRGDTVPLWHGWRLDTLLNGALSVFALILLQYKKPTTGKAEQLSVNQNLP